MPVSSSMRCSSSAVPRVAATSAWVSPRVKRAEPWARGSSPTSQVILRMSVVAAAADAPALVGDHLAHVLVLHVLVVALDLLLAGGERGELRGVAGGLGLERLQQLLLDLGEPAVAVVLLVPAVGLPSPSPRSAAFTLAGGPRRSWAPRTRASPCARRPCAERVLGVEQRPARPPGRRASASTITCLGDLPGAALHHHDGVAGGGHDHVEVGLRALGQGGVGDELAVDAGRRGRRRWGR